MNPTRSSRSRLRPQGSLGWLRSPTSLLALAAAAGCTADASPLSSPAPGPDRDEVRAHRGALAASGEAGEREAFLPSTPAPDRGAAAIAELRARGAAGLAAILAEYDAAPADRKPALASTVDAVAAQRYATVSRLYWYTDLAAAQAEAARVQKPILALRMLGRLDEDLSCANSRFFRTALYPDRQVAELLGERFILLWTSERPVPRVTIDFGDGRRMMSTVTGNSIHYVLDAEGRVLDALPGLYAPKVFATELRGALALADEQRHLRASEPGRAAARHAAYLEKEVAAIDAAYQTTGGVVWSPRRSLLGRGEARTRMEQAQRAAYGKGLVERPLLFEIAPGTDPGTIDPREIAQWAAIGQSMFAIESAAPRAPAAGAKRYQLPVVLDERARRLILTVAASEPGAPARDVAAPVPPAAPVRLLRTGERPDETLPPSGRPPAWDDALIARFEQRVVADTAQNQVLLRPRILRHLAVAPGFAPSLDELNAWVYREVFSTPRDDAWIGLRTPDEFSGLPGDGVVLPRAAALGEATATAQASETGNGYTRRR